MEERSSNLFKLDDYSPKTLDNSIKVGFKTVMSNIGSLLAIMCVVLLISMFLFDVSVEDVHLITAQAVRGFIVDASVTVILYICMQNSMILNGEKNGRQDEEFMTARKNTNIKREAAKQKGCPRMGEFCDAYVAAELRNTRERRLTRIPMKYSEWERVFSQMSRHELKALGRWEISFKPRLQIQRPSKKFEYVGDDGRVRTLIMTRKVRMILKNIAGLEEQLFTPEMLMYDDTNRSWRRLPLLPSPAEKIREKRRANYVPTIIFSIMTAVLAFKLIASPTWSTAVYCFFKLFGLIWRGAAGYSIGFLAYSVHGVQYYQSQEIRFNEYERWLASENGDGVFDF